MMEKARVLIVDDDELVREMLEFALATVGVLGVPAVDGRDALERLRGGPLPALVLLDLRMPRLDGFGVLEALKRDGLFHAVPVVAMTGDPAAGKKALAAGALACLAKPLQLDEILATVRRFLRREDRRAA